ncbi:MAG: HD domain-containing protein [Mesorhizobium sp.]|uniref:HD domain-containing protein n=1 Tax=Mesorhizobium sp. TaxID=1871066 RepID=UPI000FE88C6B|nr:HD domain-containing protein [Mesorhizobium sp.]RWB08829.1 MAG: HD domain-containing protein [Mesorhizobium sp.]RWB13521.1 MAG: HD domain-containing protein [Mesorhizobium sp.]
MSIVNQASYFAAGAHAAVGQKRKYTGEDYIHHPARVVALVRPVARKLTTMTAAAWLHDVVEDTKVTIEQIEQHFGEEVAALVEQLTDPSVPSDGNRASRRAIDREHTSRASPEAKTIKLADVIDNASSIMLADASFAKVYMTEKRELLKVLTEGHPVLFAKAKEMVDDYFEETSL